MSGSPTDGAALIAAERRRQVEAEGWTPEHDAEHTAGELTRAAVCYVTPPERRLSRCRNMTSSFGHEDRGDRYVYFPEGWPWSPDDWKPSADRVRELVKAGALIAAEIDRLLGATARESAARVAAGGELS